MAELEAEGAPLLLAAASAGALAARHPFLHASASDLRVVRRRHRCHDAAAASMLSWV